MDLYGHHHEEFESSQVTSLFVYEDIQSHDWVEHINWLKSIHLLLAIGIHRGHIIGDKDLSHYTLVSFIQVKIILKSDIDIVIQVGMKDKWKSLSRESVIQAVSTFIYQKVFVNENLI